jgi:hypothetical protein
MKCKNVRKSKKIKEKIISNAKQTQYYCDLLAKQYDNWTASPVKK